MEFPYCKCDVNNKNNFPPYSNSYFCCDFVLTKNPRNFNAKYYNNDFIMDINTMSDRIDYKVSPNVTKSLLFQKYPACSGTVGGCDLNNPNDFPPISSSRTCCDVFLQTGAISEEALKNKYPGCFEPTRREEEECKFSDPNNFPPKSDSKYCCEYILNNHVKSKEELYAKYPECNPNYCDVKPYASMPQDCEESTIGVARDIGVNEEEWKCIFQQKGSEDPYAKEFYTPNEHKIENDYCTVACREEIAYSFPSSYINVLGGNHFTVGDVSNLGNISSVYPVQFIGTSTCRTGLNQSNKAEIDYNKFASDYNTADRDVREKWDLYQIAKQKNDHSATADPGNPYKEDTTCKHHKQICEKAIRGGGVESCSAGSSGCSCHDGECDEMNQCDRYDYSIPVNYTGNIHSQTNPATYSTGCGHSKPDYEAEMKQAEKDYKEAVAKRDGMYESIKQCSSFQRTYNEFDPQVGFSYSEKKYQSSYQLKRELVKKESYSKLYSFGSSSYRTWDTGGYTTDGFITDTSLVVGNYPGIVQKSECSGESRCVYSAEPLKYPRVSKVEQVTSTTYNYVLPDNVYRYVTKEGVSYNNEYEIEEDMEYLDMGYSNLPVSYNTKPGKYDYYIEFNNLQNGNKNLFGLTQKFSRVDKWNIFDSGGVSDKFGLPVSQNMGYHCTYDVKQEFHNSCDPEVEDCDNYCNPEVEDCYDWCDPEVEDCDDGGPKGVRVIYRPIDLKNPFPGTDGNGRDPGANWNGENLDGNDLKTKYITNNRNVDTYDVYYQKPLYEFILTPENIRRIRRYNKSIDKSFADFNLECTNGINCKSKFLRDGIGNEFFKFTMKNNDGGSCFSASDPDWENCRSVNVGG